MNRFKIIVLGLINTWSVAGFAQQEAMFTQYMNNEMVINPAYAGSQEALSLTALYRNQWVGFDGAPKTMSFNGHTLLRNEHIGLGMSLVNDEIGANSTFHGYLAAAYRVKATDDLNIHLGLQGGITNFKGDYAELDLKNGGDPNFNDNYSVINPNIGAGAYLYSDKFYAGISSPRLMWNSAKIGVYEIYSQRAHGFITAGYVMDLADFVKFKPTIFFKFVPEAPMELDFSANIIYKDKYWGGVAYRSGESIDILLMWQLNQQFKLGYSYDIITNALSPYQSGSHEFVLNYRFHFVKSNHISPRYF